MSSLFRPKLFSGQYSNVSIQGSKERKYLIVTILFFVYYFVFIHAQGQTINLSDVQTFLENSLFVFVLSNSPLILL